MNRSIQCIRGLKIWGVQATCLMGQVPDFGKCFSATGTRRITRLYGPMHAVMENVHVRVWVGPSVAQGGGVERAQMLPHLWNSQKP